MEFQHVAGSAEIGDLRAHLQQLKDTADRKLLRERNMELTRQSLRESVTPDMLIIQAISAMEETDKVANTLAKRLREWYALHDPELEHRIPDHREFAEAVLQNPARAEGSMGGQLGDIDQATVRDHARMLAGLYAQRDAIVAYLEEAMRQRTPNLQRVAGTTIGAKLIALAGSLQRLATMPAGTVQLLGAETALFRHLRNPRARPPKHGIIFNHLLLQRAPRERRGKAARALADAISIAARVDHFRGEYVGEQLAAKAERAARGSQ